jgi:hypothetical protein
MKSTRDRPGWPRAAHTVAAVEISIRCSPERTPRSLVNSFIRQALEGSGWSLNEVLDHEPGPEEVQALRSLSRSSGLADILDVQVVMDS